MDPPFKFPASPGTPLFPLSPERVNGTRSPYGEGARDVLTQSPSLPNFDPSSIYPKVAHNRNNSDVQSIVARFDALTVKDQRARDEVAVKRAEMAREMAENDASKAKGERDEMEGEMRRYRHEARSLRKEVEDGRERERKVSKRVEALMDDIQRQKETSTHAQGLYEREIRKARKEAFKSSSAMVKLQEELQATRKSLRIAQSGLDAEKMKASKREQECFTAQYQLVGVQAELSKAEERIRVVEEERDALKTSLKEEEVARIAAEGRIALPVASQDEDDEFTSPAQLPRKISPMEVSEDKENQLPQRAVQLKALQQELQTERQLRASAEERLDFMRMECQFQCCSCRVAELQGSHYSHDSSLNDEIERIRRDIRALQPPINVREDIAMEDEPKIKQEPEDDVPIKEERPETPNVLDQIQEPATEAVAFDPTTGTFERVEPEAEAGEEAEQPAKPDSSPWTPQEQQIQPVQPQDVPLPVSLRASQEPLDPISEANTESSPIHVAPPAAPSTRPAPLTSISGNAHGTPSSTPVKHITTTTTTKVPIHFTPPSAAHPSQPPTPSTIAHFPISSSPSKSAIVEGDAVLGDAVIDREAALEMIRQRRGRARSMAMGHATPRKQMLAGEGGVGGAGAMGPGLAGRRDISAPALRGWR